MAADDVVKLERINPFALHVINFELKVRGNPSRG